MNINITIKTEGFGFQIFEELYAYRQSLDNQQGLNSKYHPGWNISVNAPYSKSDFNILYDYMPEEASNLDDYNLVFFCNSGEPLLSATPLMAKMVSNNKVYLISNSYLDSTHSLSGKIAWYPHNFNTCRGYWARYFYPQHFENLRRLNQPRNKNIIMINGSNKSWRYHFYKLLTEQLPNLPAVSNIAAAISKTFDSQWESKEDQQFRDYVNELYPYTQSNEYTVNYRTNTVPIGIGGKFGELMPGYFIMPEYFEYHCVVFPESTWQNNELAVTEKSLKCFYSGSLPFPIGGANINRMYNEIGFSTAWNLLPEELKKFDSILDHNTRYQEAIKAIKWLEEYPKVFQTEYSQKLVQQNQTNMLVGSCDLLAMQRLEKIILDCYNKL